MPSIPITQTSSFGRSRQLGSITRCSGTRLTLTPAPSVLLPPCSYAPGRRRGPELYRLWPARCVPPLLHAPASRTGGGGAVPSDGPLPLMSVSTHLKPRLRLCPHVGPHLKPRLCPQVELTVDEAQDVAARYSAAQLGLDMVLMGATQEQSDTTAAALKLLALHLNAVPPRSSAAKLPALPACRLLVLLPPACPLAPFCQQVKPLLEALGEQTHPCEVCVCVCVCVCVQEGACVSICKHAYLSLSMHACECGDLGHAHAPPAPLPLPLTLPCWLHA